MSQLGIKMIAAYSPEARGRSERAFSTHQDRLVKELAMAGITEIKQANDYLANTYMPAHNAEFAIVPQEQQSVFVPWAGTALQDILCEQYDRTVGNDNCVKFEGLRLQIPPDQYRCHYVRIAVKRSSFPDGGLAIFHGPRKLAVYDPNGKEICSLPKRSGMTLKIYIGGLPCSMFSHPTEPDSLFALKQDNSICWQQCGELPHRKSIFKVICFPYEGIYSK